MTRTNALTNAALDLLRANGYLAWRSNQIPVFDKATGKPRRFNGLRGVSDIIAVDKNGIFCGIEIKTAHDPLSQYQKDFRFELRRRSAFYIVVRDTVDELTAFIEANK